MAGKTFVEIEGLSYTYPGNAAPTLRDINLRFYDDELAMLVGPTGCGKSTLVMALNGLVPQITGGEFKGSVTVDGMNTLEKRVADLSTRIGLVFQDPEAQLVNLYVHDEVGFGCENVLIPRDEVNRRVDKYLGVLDCLEQKYSFCHMLSTGQKHKVAIAAILAMEPRMIVLDEPTADMDPYATGEMLHCVGLLRKNAEKSVLVIEHKVDDVVQMADRVILMDKGRIVSEGPPHEIFDKYTNLMRKDLGVRVPQICELATDLRARGCRISTFPLNAEEAYKTVSEMKLKLRPQDHSVKTDGPVRVGDPLIEIRDVGYTYKDGTRALEDVNLSIYQGEFLAIVGANGAGKSTLTKNIAGLYHPTQGRILIEGTDSSNQSASEITKKVGYVFQQPENQFVQEVVKDEVAFSMRLQRMDESVIQQKTLELLADFELSPYFDSYVQKLSRGQKRRLSIITMLGIEQKALMLDEPTTGQDWRGVVALIDLLKDYSKKKGLTVILVTHDMRIVCEWADRVVTMNNGRIVFDGDVRTLFSSERILRDSHLVSPPIVLFSRYLMNDHSVGEVFLRNSEFLEAVEGTE